MLKPTFTMLAMRGSSTSQKAAQMPVTVPEASSITCTASLRESQACVR